MHAVRFNHSALADREVLRKENRRHIFRIPPRVTGEELLLRRDVVVDTDIPLIQVHPSRALVGEVVLIRHRIANCVGLRIEFHCIQGDRVHASRRDAVAGVGVANKAAGWVRTRREGVEDLDEIPV